MDDPPNPVKTYLDVAFPVCNASPDELDHWRKHGQDSHNMD